MKHIFLYIFLLIALFCPFLPAATPQTMEILGYVTHPVDGAYHQKIGVRVQVIKRKYGELAEGEAKEDIVWNKTFHDVQIFNGQFQLLLDVDDEGLPIDKDVFQSSIEYSFDGTATGAEKRLQMADFPDATYAMRFYMRRSYADEFERIRPDFNVDGSPLSFSALNLDGADIKFGKMEIRHIPATEDAEGAVLKVDTQPGNIPAGNLSHGVFLENATVTIDTNIDSPNLAFNIEGSAFFRDSDLILSGNSELTAGSIKLQELCMSFDCEAAGALFTGNLFAYSSVQFSKFFDSDGPEAAQRPIAYRDPIYNYQLDPSGQSNFKFFSLSNLDTRLFPDTLRIKDKADLYLDGFSGLRMIGGSTKLFVGERDFEQMSGVSGGGIQMEMDEADLTAASDVSRFKFDERLRFGSGSETVVGKYRDSKFYKVRAGTLKGHRRPHPRSEYQGEYYFRPSSESNIKALRFHFGDLAAAKININQRVARHFAATPEKTSQHSVEIVYDPVLTEEIINGLLGGDYYEFHNHDLMAQAQPEELIDIINNPAHITEKKIRYFQLDPILARTPTPNTWQQPVYFNRLDTNSFLLRGNLVASWQGQETSLPDSARGVAILGGDPEEGRGFIATGNYQLRKVDFRDRNQRLNVYAGGLSLHSAPGYGGGNLVLDMESTRGSDYQSHPAILTVGNEFGVEGNMDVDGSFYSGGTQIFGCFHFPCPEEGGQLFAGDIYNVKTISASRFFDANMQNSLDPSESTTLADAEITDHLRLRNVETFFLGNLTVTGNMAVESGSAIIGSTSAESASRQVMAPVFRSFSAPADKYTVPSAMSRWTNLDNRGKTDISGSLEALSDISIGGDIYAENALVYQDSTIRGQIKAAIFKDLDSADGGGVLTMVLDPDKDSKLSELTVAGLLTAHANTVIDGNVDVVGDVYMKDRIEHGSNLFTPVFVDMDNAVVSSPDYYVYPEGLSEINSLLVTQTVDMETLRAENVRILGELRVSGNTGFDGKLSVHGNTQVGERFILAVGTDIVPECKMTEPDGMLPATFNFCVDSAGHMYGRSLTLDRQGVFERGVFGGVVKVEEDVTFNPPTNFHELHLSIAQYLQLTDAAEIAVLHVDDEGHTSLAGRLETTGFLRFLSASTKGRIDRDEWKIGSENIAVNDFSLEKDDGSGLDLSSFEMTSVLSPTVGYSKPFIIKNETSLRKIYDADDHDFYMEPKELSVFRQLSQRSSNPVTVSPVPVKTPRINDLDDPRYKIDPESDSRLNALTVDNMVLLHQHLHIKPDSVIPLTDFTTKILISTADTTAGTPVLQADNFFSLSRTGDLTSSLEFLHKGSVRLYDSYLKLGTGATEISIGKLDITTLLLLPDSWSDANFNSTTRAYWADHLHYHDRIDEVDTDLYARRSQDNTFLGVNRFLHETYAVELRPSSFSPSVWITRTQTAAVGYNPFVLPGDDYFLVAACYSDEFNSAAMQTILSFEPDSTELLYVPTQLPDRPSSRLHWAAARSGDGSILAFAGGLSGQSIQKDFYRYNMDTDAVWQEYDGTLRIAYPQMAAVGNNFFIFGGHYIDSEGMQRPNTYFNLISYNGNIPENKHGSNFPACDQQLEESVFYLKEGKLYRNKTSLDDERLVLDAGTEILAPQLSFDRTEICFHTLDYKLRIYNLVTAKETELRSTAHSCAWGHSSERDYIYFLDNSDLPLEMNYYGNLRKIRKDGNDFASLNRDEYDVRSLQIAEDGQVYMIAQAEIAAQGERLIVAVTDTDSRLLNSDGTDEEGLFNFSARDFATYQGELSFIATPAEANAGNNAGSGADKENLFLSGMDGTDLRQASYFPQGIKSRVAFNQSAHATVGVSAFYVDDNHLPLDYTGGCSVQYGGYVYLFGAGPAKDKILQYNMNNDSWYELTEASEGTSGGFSCAYDGNETVYFFGEARFARFDMAQKRFWPLDAPVGTDESSGGPMAFSVTEQKLWFLDENPAGNGFYEFDPVSVSWSAHSTSGVNLSGSRLIALDSDLYLFGNDGAQTNLKFSGGSWSALGDIPDGAGLHEISLLPHQNEAGKIMLLAGKIGAANEAVYIYDTISDSYVSSPELLQGALNAGFAFDNQNQLYIFGGEGSERALQIYPLNAENDGQFRQIFNVELVSGKKNWQSSAPLFDLPVSFSDGESGKFAYAGSDGVYVYDQFANFHSKIHAISGSVITGLDTVSDREYIYFSVAEADLSSGVIYRMLPDGSELTEISSALLSKAAGESDQLMFINPDHSRVYFRRDNKLFQAAFSSEQSPQAILSGTDIVSAHLHSTGASISEIRDGVFLRADSTALSSIETSFFDGLILRDLALTADESVYFAAKPYFSTTGLYVWQPGLGNPQAVYDAGESNFVNGVFYNPFAKKLWFTETETDFTSSRLMELTANSAIERTEIGGNPTGAFAAKAFEPNMQRNRSFVFENRIYALVGQKLYRSNNVAVPDVLEWSLYDTLSIIDNNYWQVTQYKNRIYFYDENTAGIYEYFPYEKQLARIGTVGINDPVGTLAALDNNFYLIGNDSVAQMGVLSGISDHISLDVYSAADENPDGTAKKLFSFDPSGQVFAREMHGAADFVSGSISGGPGDLGILDGSLSKEDLMPATIDTIKLADNIFSGDHIQLNQIEEGHFDAKILETVHFQENILNSDKIADENILTGHLSSLTLFADKIKDLSLTNEDFSRRSIANEHIKSDTISTDIIDDLSLVAANFKDLDLIKDDFANDSLGTKQVSDGSIIDADIATETIEEYHFQIGSVTTAKIDTQAVTFDKIADKTLTVTRFADFAVTTETLADLTIYGSAKDGSSINELESLFVTGAVSSGHIRNHDEGVSTENIGPLQITSDKMADLLLVGSEDDVTDLSGTGVGSSKVAADTLEEKHIETETITNRELGTGSVDYSKILADCLIDCQEETWLSAVDPGDCTSSVIHPEAITISKIATGETAFTTDNIRDAQIIDRHLFAGGQGELTIFTGTGISGLINPGVAAYQNRLYFFGGGVDLGLLLHNLSTKTSNNTTVYDVTGGLLTLSGAYAAAYDERYAYLYGENGKLLKYDFTSSIASEIATHASPLGPVPARAFLAGGYFIMAADDKLHLCNVTTGLWQEKNLPANSFSGAEAFYHEDGRIYLFGNGVVYGSDDLGDSWDGGVALDGLPNLIDSHVQAYAYPDSDTRFYIFGGVTNSNAIYKFDQSLNSLTNLQNQSINVEGAGNNYVLLYQHRFYIPDFSSGNLIVWHPNMDASIASRHIDSNAVYPENIRPDSLSAINLAENSIDSARIKNLQIQNININNNVLTTHSVGPKVFTSEHFSDNSITSEKISTDPPAVDSRVLRDYDITDSRFADNSITAIKIESNAITHEAIADYQITSDKIASEQITLSKVGERVVTGGNIIDDEIATVDIADLTMDERVIADQSIETHHILEGNILSRHIKDENITRSLIAMNTLTADDFSVDAFNATTMFVDEAIQEKHIKEENITHEKITVSLAHLLTNVRFATGVVDYDHLHDDAIRESHIDTDTINEDLVLEKTLLDRSFADNSIDYDKLADGSLTEHAFATGTLTASSFVSQSLTAAVFALESIRTEHFVSYSIDTDNIMDGGINIDVAPDSVDTERFVSYTLEESDFSDDAVTTDVLHFGSVLSQHITLEAGSLIQSVKISDDQISTLKLVTDSLLESHIADNALTASKILSYSLSGRHLKENNLSGGHFEADSVAGYLFVSDTITGLKISDYTITGESIAPYQIYSTQVKDLSVVSAHIDTDAVDMYKLAPDSIDTDRIMERSIRGSSVVSYTLGPDNIVDGAIRTDLIQDGVIGQRYSFYGETDTDAETSAISSVLGAVIPFAEYGYALLFKQGDRAISKTEDNFQNISAVGTDICVAGTLTALFLFDPESGYAACGTDLYLIENISTGLHNLVTSFDDSISDLHFFDWSHGVVRVAQGNGRIYSTANYGVHWTMADTENQVLKKWTFLDHTMVVPGGSDYWRTDNSGLTWNKHTPGTAGFVGFYNAIFDPDTDELYASIKDSQNTSWVVFTDNTNYTNLSPETENFFHQSKPSAQPVYAHRKFYLPATQTDYGVIEYDIEAQTFARIKPDFVHVGAGSSSTEYLIAPVYMGDYNFVFTQSDGSNLLYSLNFYDHVAKNVLSVDRLTDSALTTDHFRNFTISGAKIDDAQLDDTHIRSAAFTHGEYLLKEESAEQFVSLFSGSSETIIFGLKNDGRLYMSSDGGISFAEKLSSQVTGVHGHGSVWLAPAASGGSLYLSTDTAENFTEITVTPFDDVQAVWVFDEENMLAAGRKGDDFIMARYDSELSEFQAITDAAGTVIITTASQIGAADKVSDLLFTDGRTGYISINQTEATAPAKAIVLKTADGGESWSAVFNSSNIHDTGLYAFDPDKVFYYASEKLYPAAGGGALFAFPGIISDLSFITPQIGFVLVGAEHKIYKSEDGGDSFYPLYELADPLQPQTIVNAGEGSLLLSGDGLNLQRLYLPIRHNPFTELAGDNFATDELLQGGQIAAGSLKQEKLVSSALETTHFADYALAADRLEDEAVTEAKIIDYSLSEELFAYQSLTTDKLKDDYGIHGDSIKEDVLSSDRIALNSITSQELSSDALGENSFAPGSITEPKIKDDSIYGTVLGEKVILTTHLVDGGFSETQFASDSFHDEQFADASIEADRLATPFAMPEDRLLSDTLTGSALQAGQITDRLFGTDSIYHYLIETGTIAEDSLNGGAVTLDKWHDYVIDSASLNEGIISSDKLSAISIENEHIRIGVLSSDYYDGSTIPADKLQKFSFKDREFSAGAFVAGKFSTNASWLLTSSYFDSEVVSSTRLTGVFPEAKFADDAFNNQKFADRVFGENQMQDGILIARHFADGLLTGNKFALESISAEKLKPGEKFDAKLVNSSITGEKIVSHSLADDNFATDIAADKLHGRVFFASHFGNVALDRIAAASISSRVVQKQGMTVAVVQDQSFTDSHFQADSISADKIADDFVTLGDVSGKVIGNAKLLDYTLLNADFADNAITGSRIKASTLTGGEFEDGFLHGDAITASSVTTAKLADSAITHREIDNLTLGSNHIRASSLTSSVFALLSLTDADFAEGSIDTDDIVDGSIDTDRIENLTLQNSHFASRAVSGGHFAELLPAGKIGTGIDGDRIAETTLVNDDLTGIIALNRFASDSIAQRNIDDAQITSAVIAENTVDGSQFAAGLINEDRIGLEQLEPAHLDGTIDTEKIADETVTERELADETLINASFADDAIAEGSISAGDLPLSKLADYAIAEESLTDTPADKISGSKIADSAIVNDQIKDDTFDVSELGLTNLGESRVEAASMKWSNLATDALAAENIADGTVSAAHIKDGEFDLNNIAVSALDDSHITDGILTPEQFDAPVSALKFQDGVFDGIHIKKESLSDLKFTVLSADKIMENTMTATHFGDTENLFTAVAAHQSKMKSASVSADKFSEELTGGKIGSGEFDPAQQLLAGEKFTETHISALDLPASKFSDLSGINILQDAAGVAVGLLTTDYLAADTIDTANIADGSITTAMLDVTVSEFQKLLNMGDGDSDDYADDLHWHDRPEVSACPTGFTSGSGNLSFCIKEGADAKTVSDAVSDCSARNARLCSMQELYSACRASDGITATYTYATLHFTGTTALAVKTPALGGDCEFTTPLALNFNSDTSRFACCTSF